MKERKRADYDRVTEKLFDELYLDDQDTVELLFSTDDVIRVVRELGIAVNNIPDIGYTYSSGRKSMPHTILARGNWAIEGKGKSQFAFVNLKRSPYVDMPNDLEIIQMLDSTPQIVLKFQSEDEQSLLSKIRYNRLVDIFTGLTTYHLQGHFRAAVARVGQVEIDDLYIGVDTDGVGFMLPVEAKATSPREKLGIVQITKMVKFMRQNYPGLVVRPIGVKAEPDGSYLFVEFNDTTDSNDVKSKRYKRYLLYRER